MTWPGWHGHSAVSDRMERETETEETLTVGGVVAIVWAICAMGLLVFVPAMVTCGALR